MAPIKKRIIGPRKKKVGEIPLYDYTDATKMTLRYVGRPASVADGGVSRLLSTPHGTEKDNLCKMLYAELLMGEALQDAVAVCPPKPDDFIFPDRFVKRYNETD